MIQNLNALIKNTEPRYQRARKDALETLDAVLVHMNGYHIIKSSVCLQGSQLTIQETSFDISQYKHIFVIGFGKASGSMGHALEEILHIDDGVVITTENIHCSSMKVRKGSHPLPSEQNIKHTDEVLSIVSAAKKEDLIICLISGGGSSLLSKPRISLEGMQSVMKELMEKGCTINELNTVRKHLSFVKGGQLAQSTKAHIISLVISDIIGNPLQFIASGPTCADTTTFEDAMNVLTTYGVTQKEVIDVIRKGVNGVLPETPKKLCNVDNIIVADISTACDYAEHLATLRGYQTKIISTQLSGEAREVGQMLAEQARALLLHPGVLIAGGETTVTVTGMGRGGRNQEMALSVLSGISHESIVFLSCGTDGIDGNSPAAGAITDGGRYKSAIKQNLRPEAFLADNNSYEFFHALGDAILTGYTGGNVMDIQIIIKF